MYGRPETKTNLDSNYERVQDKTESLGVYSLDTESLVFHYQKMYPSFSKITFNQPKTLETSGFRIMYQMNSSLEPTYLYY